ncbi:MAG: hypothetical protein Harvfovirus83_5 [Harvfovirus sp.]|uniref:Uncharacterized protein n=1 Tax=Harvfovirus sp. TaxID=2487768 RepID=A0A3G5A626_9VIRU|nr:MAG: hypothetical protein Harvfovirus83_5 [Harvfovirus sp.]
MVRRRSSKRRGSNRNVIRNKKNVSGHEPCGPDRILRRTYFRRPTIKTISRNDDEMTSVRGSVVPARCIRARSSKRNRKKLTVASRPELLEIYNYNQIDSPIKRHKALDNATKRLGADTVFYHLKTYNALQKRNSVAYDNVASDLKYLKKHNTIKRRTSRSKKLVHI